MCAADVVESLQRKMEMREQDLLARVALAGSRRKEMEDILQAERKRHSVLRHNYDSLIARRKTRKASAAGTIIIVHALGTVVKVIKAHRESLHPDVPLAKSVNHK